MGCVTQRLDVSSFHAFSQSGSLFRVDNELFVSVICLFSFEMIYIDLIYTIIAIMRMRVFLLSTFSFVHSIGDSPHWSRCIEARVDLLRTVNLGPRSVNCAIEERQLTFGAFSGTFHLNRVDLLLGVAWRIMIH